MQDFPFCPPSPSESFVHWLRSSTRGTTGGRVGSARGKRGGGRGKNPRPDKTVADLDAEMEVRSRRSFFTSSLFTDDHMQDYTTQTAPAPAAAAAT